MLHEYLILNGSDSVLFVTATVLQVSTNLLDRLEHKPVHTWSVCVVCVCVCVCVWAGGIILAEHVCVLTRSCCYS